MGKSNGWENTLKTNAILADIYDMLQVINSNVSRLGGSRKKKIKPYPRPGDKDGDTKHIGKGALPFNKLCEWIQEKRNGKR